MSLIKKFAWSGSAVAASAAAAVALLFAGQATVAQAAAPTLVNVIIEDADDSISSPTTVSTTVRVVVDVDDAGGGATDETIVSLTSSIGTWASSGTNSASVECAVDDAAVAAAAVDAGDENVTVSITNQVYSNEAEVGNDDDVADANEEGCNAVEAFLIIPVNAAVGTYSVVAQTLNGIAASENLVITAGTGTTAAKIEAVGGTNPTHKAIGYTSSGTFEPLVNGAIWTIRVTDATGAGVNDVQVQFSTDKGKLGVVQDNDGDASTGTEADIRLECASTTTKGTSSINTTATIGTTSTNTGRARVVICGTSDAAGGTATLTAKTLGASSFTTTGQVTVGGKPKSSDVKVTVTGGVVDVEVMVGGVPAADDLDVIFSVVPNDQAVVVPGCVSLLDGKAQAVVSSVAGSGAVVASVFENNVECDGSTIRLDGSAQAAIGAGGPTTPGGTGGFTGTAPARGSIGLLVTSGASNAAGLVGALGTAGCPVESLAILEGGVWKIYINGAPAVVNAAFPASVPATTAFFVRCSA